MEIYMHACNEYDTHTLYLDSHKWPIACVEKEGNFPEPKYIGPSTLFLHSKGCPISLGPKDFPLIIETDVTSWTAKWLYSDSLCYGSSDDIDVPHPLLFNLSYIPVIGILTSLTRLVLGVLHTLGHLIAYAITKNKGHQIHAIKGSIEILYAFIESIPLVGRIYLLALYLNEQSLLIGPFDTRPQFLIRSFKIYNPKKLDAIDCETISPMGGYLPYAAARVEHKCYYKA